MESYRPSPDRQYLPQRTECGRCTYLNHFRFMLIIIFLLLITGVVRNDSVIGDPLFTVPVHTENGERRTLCFEVHGESNRTFNLISDTCLNVNAHYHEWMTSISSVPLASRLRGTVECVWIFKWILKAVQSLQVLAVVQQYV